MQLLLWFTYSGAAKPFAIEVFKMLRRYEPAYCWSGFTAVMVKNISHYDAKNEISRIKAVAEKFGGQVVTAITYKILNDDRCSSAHLSKLTCIEEGRFDF